MFSFSPKLQQLLEPGHVGVSFFCPPRTEIARSNPLDLMLQTVPGVSHTKLLFFSTDYCIVTTNTTSRKIHHDCSYLISTAQIYLKHLIFLACAHLAPLGFPPEVSILKASVWCTSNRPPWVYAPLFCFQARKEAVVERASKQFQVNLEINTFN